jgi:hypothetical protein
MKKRLTVALGVAVLTAGLAGTHVAAQGGNDPLSNIIAKLDLILAALSASEVDLRGVTQNWDKALPANDPGGPCPSGSSRFTCVFGGAAVRDNQTGLVWEQSPSSVRYTWNLGVDSVGHLGSAREYCTLKMTGGQMGWRLPAMQELTSLVDPSLNDNEGTITLPPGHPFTNIAGIFEGYWSATTTAENPNTAWIMGFARIGAFVPFSGKENKARVWCVRGGTTADTY